MDDRLPLPEPVRADRASVGQCPIARAELDAVLGRLEAVTFDAPQGFRERLRSLPTWARAALAAGVALLAGAALLAALGLRADLSAGSLVGEVGVLAGLALLVALATAVGLRGAHQRPLGRLGWVVASVVLFVPAGLGFLPDVFGVAHLGPMTASDPGLGCLCLGFAAAAIVGVAAGLLQRGQHTVGWRLGAIAGAGGLVAFVATQLHCPSPDLLHRVVGHGGAGLALFAMLMLTRPRGRAT
ncbi:MAG: hypothetical protein R3F39_20120 [Myxococcota bacterium]